MPLVISGAGLDAVTSVSILPADGLTLGSATPNADGTTLTVPVTIAADAPTTVRQVIVSAGTTRYLPASGDADRIKVVMPPPVVDSLVPIFGAGGTDVLAVTVVGRNFQDLQAISFAPADGIAVGPASVNASGTLINFSLSIDAGAPLGPRLVTVTTRGGTSSLTLAPANTFTVVNEIQQSITPIAAPPLGVVVEEAVQPPAPQTLSLGPAVVGVTYGSAITAMNPNTGVIGETVGLSLQGSDLSGVTGIQFVPDTGLTVGTLQIAADGNSVTAAVSIAPDAPQTVRTVQVFADTQRILFASPSAALFRVTPPLPRVDSINPLFVQVGAPLTTLTVGGVNFQNASQVRVLPADGVTISAPSVNADATVVTVSIAAAADATPGPRVVTVVTPAGETTSTASVANTLTLTTAAGANFGPFRTMLGVVLEGPPAPPISTPFGPFAAPPLGVLVEQEPPPPVSSAQFAMGSPVGISVGPFAQSLTPPGVLAGGTVVLTITGANLDAVTDVGFVPSDGLTIGAPSVTPDGTQLSVSVTAAGTAEGERQLSLASAAAPVLFADLAKNTFTVVPAIPQIDSIDPIFGTQGQNASLVIRGSNLQYATGVSVLPAGGVTFGSVAVNGAGTELTVSFNVAIDAAIGPRVIQVLTPAGATSAEGTAANTFTVRAP